MDLQVFQLKHDCCFFRKSPRMYLLLKIPGLWLSSELLEDRNPYFLSDIVIFVSFTYYTYIGGTFTNIKGELTIRWDLRGYLTLYLGF